MKHLVSRSTSSQQHRLDGGKVQVNCTRAEYSHITNEARRYGIKRAAYIRLKLFNRIPPTALPDADENTTLNTHAPVHPSKTR